MQRDLFRSLAPRSLAVLALLALAACSGGGGDGGPPTEPAKGAISGTVSAGGAGVAGAAVALSGGGGTTQTSGAGTFAFNGVTPGSYTLTVTPPAGFVLGAEAATKNVTVAANQTANVAWTLQVETAPGRRDIHMGAASFTPADVTIATGTTVRWINDLAVPHTITPDNAAQGGVWASQNITAQGQTFDHVFTTAGTYDYHCNVHAGMTGKVRVQ